MFGVITISFGLYTHLGSVLFWVVSSSYSLFTFNGRATFRKSILDLHQRFQCGSGWGLERTLNAWVIKQPWGQRLPLSFFETLFFTQSMFFLHHWKKMGRSFLETMIVNTTEVRCWSAFHPKNNFALRYFSIWAPEPCKVLLAVYQSIHWPLKVQLTEQQALLGGHRSCKQHVMLPHDIVSYLYNFPENFFPTFTGEPGRLQRYWEQNLDLFESLNMPGLDAWHGIIWPQMYVKFVFNSFKTYVWGFQFVGYPKAVGFQGSQDVCALETLRGWGKCPAALWDQHCLTCFGMWP